MLELNKVLQFGYKIFPQEAHALKVGPQLVESVTERQLDHEGSGRINGFNL